MSVPVGVPVLTRETVIRPNGERVPINIAAEVRDQLCSLLYEPEMRGVGYSEFVQRAVTAAWKEIASQVCRHDVIDHLRDGKIICLGCGKQLWPRCLAAPSPKDSDPGRVDG